MRLGPRKLFLTPSQNLTVKLVYRLGPRKLFLTRSQNLAVTLVYRLGPRKWSSVLRICDYVELQRIFLDCCQMNICFFFNGTVRSYDIDFSELKGFGCIRSCSILSCSYIIHLTDSRNLHAFSISIADSQTWIQISTFNTWIVNYCGTSCLITLIWNIEFANVLQAYALLFLMFTIFTHNSFLEDLVKNGTFTVIIFKFSCYQREANCKVETHLRNFIQFDLSWIWNVDYNGSLQIIITSTRQCSV